MQKHGLYICFEGLDGVGKSTIVSSVKQKFDNDDYSVEIVSSTAKAPACHLIERAFKKSHKLNNSRFWRFFLFAHRSNHAAKQANWNADIIVGDRSIITSYIYRWTNKPFVNKVHVSIINLFEPLLPSPDIIVYCCSPRKTIERRLNLRGECDIDENETRAKRLEGIYETFYAQNANIKRIRNVQWIKLECIGSPEEVSEKAYKLLRSMINERN